MTGVADASCIGVVVHVGAWGEAHRLVELITADSGRRTLLARHARASRRRFVGSLEIFATLQVQLSHGRGRWPTLASVDVLQARLPIRRSLAQICRASALCTCARQLAPEGQAAPTVLRLLSWGLDAVAAGASVAASRALPRLAQAAGIVPPLDSCCRCGQGQVPLARLPEAVGLGCQRCHPRGEPLAPALRQALVGGPVADAQVAQALEDCILDWLGLHVGRPLRRLAPELAQLGPHVAPGGP